MCEIKCKGCLYSTFLRGVFESSRKSKECSPISDNPWHSNDRSWGGCTVLFMREPCLHQQLGSGLRHLCRRRDPIPTHSQFQEKQPRTGYRRFAQTAERLSSLGFQKAWRSTHTASFVCCTLWLKESQLIATEKASVTKRAPELTGSSLTGGDGVKLSRVESGFSILKRFFRLLFSCLYHESNRKFLQPEKSYFFISCWFYCLHIFVYPESGRKQKQHSSTSLLHITTMLGTIKVSGKIYIYEMYLIVQAVLFLSRD